MAKKRALTELIKGPMAKMMPRWLQGHARDPTAVVGAASLLEGRMLPDRGRYASHVLRQTLAHCPQLACLCICHVLPALVLPHRPHGGAERPQQQGGAGAAHH